jgi:hypothetical protein
LFSDFRDFRKSAHPAVTSGNIRKLSDSRHVVSDVVFRQRNRRRKMAEIPRLRSENGRKKARVQSDRGHFLLPLEVGYAAVLALPSPPSTPVRERATISPNG